MRREYTHTDAEHHALSRKRNVQLSISGQSACLLEEMDNILNEQYKEYKIIIV